MLLSCTGNDPVPGAFTPPVIEDFQVEQGDNTTSVVITCKVSSMEGISEYGVLLQSGDESKTIACSDLRDNVFSTTVDDLEYEISYSFQAYIGNGRTKTLSSLKKWWIEPLEPIVVSADCKMTITIPPSDEIWYVSHSGETIPLANPSSLLVSNTYSGGIGVYKFSEEINDIGKILDYSVQCTSTRENEDFKELILPKSISSIGLFGLSHFCKATAIVLPAGLTALGTDSFCGYGEKTYADNHLYFISETAPRTNGSTFWNQHGRLFVHYPSEADYGSLESPLQGWLATGVRDWSYTMVPTEYTLTYK